MSKYRRELIKSRKIVVFFPLLSRHFSILDKILFFFFLIVALVAIRKVSDHRVNWDSFSSFFFFLFLRRDGTIYAYLEKERERVRERKARSFENKVRMQQAWLWKTARAAALVAGSQAPSYAVLPRVFIRGCFVACFARKKTKTKTKEREKKKGISCASGFFFFLFFFF